MQHADELKEARAALEGAVTISKLAANVRTTQSHALPSSHGTALHSMHKSLNDRLWQQLPRRTTNIQVCLHLQTHMRVHSASGPHLPFPPGTVTGQCELQCDLYVIQLKLFCARFSVLT